MIESTSLCLLDMVVRAQNAMVRIFATRAALQARGGAERRRRQQAQIGASICAVA